MDEVLELVGRWASAEESNDSARLDGVLAPGFVGVGAAGFVLSREQWLGRFDGGLRNRSFVVEEPRVFAHGADTAVVVGVDDQRTGMGERDVSGRFRLTLTAVRTAEGWRVASVHLGPLQPAATAPPGPDGPARVTGPDA